MTTTKIHAQVATKALIWQLEAGIDECIGEQATDHFQETAAGVGANTPQSPDRSQLKSATNSRPLTEHTLTDQAHSENQFVDFSGNFHKISDQLSNCKTLNELEQFLRGFDQCSLKRTATNTVFSDGNPDSKIMFVGEAPGADEDRQGRPFVGASGQLFDKMLASIALDRTNTYITNIVYWRPPGNRNPTNGEITMCLPFLVRQIELVGPEVLVLLGGPATKTLLGVSEGITKMRGKWHSYRINNSGSDIAVLPFFHPAYLLRSPAHKRHSWQDLLAVKNKLERS